ncbi:MAG TPA: hypothetical protein ENL20_02060 [Candidatus Cloacimonetes bacterium]|nr:hypothetical protein [Candidatus Cloacimonadota bacterium]
MKKITVSLFFFLSITLLFSSLPHSVHGVVLLPDGETAPSKEEFDYAAYITLRPEEVRYLGDFGNGYFGEHGFILQVGNFPTMWTAGEYIHFDFMIDDEIRGSAEIQITNAGLDKFPEPIILKSKAELEAEKEQEKKQEKEQDKDIDKEEAEDN